MALNGLYCADVLTHSLVRIYLSLPGRRGRGWTRRYVAAAARLVQVHDVRTPESMEVFVNPGNRQ